LAKKNKQLSRKPVKDRKQNNNCNISDVTDSVEFADEPFENFNKKKQKNKHSNGGGGC